ncbi:MAG: glycogen synthase GlgA [Clostridiales bacterium]|nr:glycogen synthase GlgA [Clostridiales bacterium]
MKIVMLSSEVVPYAKTGGLADVTGALPKYLSHAGAEVLVFLPLYRETKNKNLPLQKAVDSLKMEWPAQTESFSVWKHRHDSLSFFFVEKDEYFDRDYLYGTPKGDYPDNGERFAFFCRAALETLKAMGFQPEIIHAHDWQAAMALAYLKFNYAQDPFFSSIRSLFTIHNLAYQGIFEKDLLARIGLPEALFNMEDLEFYGKVNFLKAGILYSTAVNTVSPHYSQEIQTPEFGHGLDGLLRKRRQNLYGILNGVDYSGWNPATDRFIARNFDADNLAGKTGCKRDLLQSFSLPPEAETEPVVGMVSRLAGQKGFDLLSQAVEEIFRSGANLIILGTGEEVYQNALRSVQKKYPQRFGLMIAFDEALAHKIYAGSDIFLIPSRYEPCGLTQMYSLRYGTIPVVRATGGLDDTIQEFDPDSLAGNGFKFVDYEKIALVDAVRRAVAVYQDKERWQVLVRNAIACDFSWEKSAAEYFRLYKRIISP